MRWKQMDRRVDEKAREASLDVCMLVFWIFTQSYAVSSASSVATNKNHLRTLGSV